MQFLNGQPALLEIVATLHAPRRLARRLHGGQQQRHQDADHRDDDQQFHQREARSRFSARERCGDDRCGAHAGFHGNESSRWLCAVSLP